MQDRCHREAYHPPSVNDAGLALADLRTLLKSQNTTLRSDNVLRTRLDRLDRFLAIYTSGKGGLRLLITPPQSLGGFQVQSTASSVGKNFIRDRSALPHHRYKNSGRNSLR